MKALVEKMLACLRQGERVVLCSILASSGSAPRGEGAKMAVFADGSTMGTIGGGQAEWLSIQQAVELLETGESKLRSFDLTPDPIYSVGMACGGTVTVYYQCFCPEDGPGVATLEKLRRALQKEENAWLLTAISQSQVVEFAVYGEREIPTDRQELFATRPVLQRGDPLVLVEPVARKGRVYIFGGGHVGKALVPVLHYVDFRVTMFDDRKEFARPENFPKADQVIYGDFAHIGDKVTVCPQDYVVIMTSGHQGDYAVLAQALRTQATYIGCIGSRKKFAAIFAKLAQEGIPEKELQRVHAPIGLNILAQTPQEIAISVAAELIRHRQEQL